MSASTGSAAALPDWQRPTKACTSSSRTSRRRACRWTAASPAQHWQQRVAGSTGCRHRRWHDVRLMVIAAHPQDPFERAGGTVARHLDRGDEARFVSLTTGVVTHAFGIFPAIGDDKLKDVERVKETKRGEFEEASRILGVTSGRVYDFNESPLATGPDEYLAIIDEIRTFRPDAVLCPHPTEFGRFDHMDAGRFAVAAVDYARADGIPSSLA